jgi:NAD(P)-dependent dehydrogenase (short-subunit alcohol dehydrogenase family)
MANLSNKTALVTGASRGIGRATAIALADAGARVLVHY